MDAGNFSLSKINVTRFRLDETDIYEYNKSKCVSVWVSRSALNPATHVSPSARTDFGGYWHFDRYI